MLWDEVGGKNRKVEDYYLPRIRTAEYDQLSVSTEEEEESGQEQPRVEGERGVGVGWGGEGGGGVKVKEGEEGGVVGGGGAGIVDDSSHLFEVVDDDDDDDAKIQGKTVEGNGRQGGRFEGVQTEGAVPSAELIIQEQPIITNDVPEGQPNSILPVEGSENLSEQSTERSASNSDSDLGSGSDRNDDGESENEQDHSDLPEEDASGHWFDDEEEEDQSDNGDGIDDDDEDEYDDDEASVSTWSGNSHFTEIQRIDLEKQAQGDWGYRHGQLYYLGSIWDLRSRRHECRLCWRLWRQTRRNPDIKKEYLSKSRCIMKLMELKGRRTDESDKEIVMLNLVYIYGYKLGDPRRSDWIVRMPFVLQGTHKDACDLRSEIPSDEIIPFDDRLFGQARKRDDSCNYQLIREWLKTCEIKHDHPIPEFTGEMTIRLVDTKQKCLIEWKGPTSEAPRFVALSYVWGRSRQKVMLTTDRLSDFKQPGFFDRSLDQTIRDSIDLVARIEEKYLWIDSLCILQDSRDDKDHQIPQMHKIYGKAILTIVAAHGDHADSGLPGVGVGSRIGNQFKLELDDIRISFRSQTKFYAPVLDIGFIENYLRSSVYQGRAWTFQESHLSARMLVFTKDQVYWECEKTAWCEETHWESDAIDFISWRAVKNPCPPDVWNDRFERRAYDILGTDELEQPEPPRNSYAAIIKEYSNRELSHDQDILDACTGVLLSIKEREQSDFFFALRKKHFGNDLLFNILKAVPRRFPDQASAESGFPTWSWVSWKGAIEIANEPRNNSYDLVENLVPCDGVKCYMLDTDQHGRRNVQVINETGGWRFRHDYVRDGEGIYDLAQPHATSGSDRNENKAVDVGFESGGEGSDTDLDQNEEQIDFDEGSHALGAPESVQGWTSDQSNEALSGQSNEALPATAVTSGANAKPPETNSDIPEYSQDISLADIESHPAFSHIVPSFHIIFRTFSSVVVLRTEYDEMSIRMSKVVIAGTKKTRGGGVWENRDHIQRNLYACKKKPRKPVSASEPDRKNLKTSDDEEAHPHDHEAGGDSCPCCGRDSRPAPLPESLELGAYLGRIPPSSSSWNVWEYMHTIPDGIYRLLWMNNNQLPMFGHLLCKPLLEDPALSTGDRDGDWDGVILQRVSGVVGPTDILIREQQELYAAEWGIHILG